MTLRVAYESGGLPLPNKSTFQSGDMIWPKKPGSYVPYRSGENSSFEEEQKRWSIERDKFLGSLKSNPGYLTSSQVHELRGLSYREFYARYAGNRKPNVPGTYSSGSGIYVGHVGILEIDSSGTPWVIEALWGRGVLRHPYDDWIKARPGEIVWHGRVRDIERERRARIVPVAKNYVGLPYDFWNFDLNDDAGFYCSKLVWLCSFRALGLAIDGNPDPRRAFWFSPKQLLYAKTIARLHDPGPYTNG